MVSLTPAFTKKAEGVSRPSVWGDVNRNRVSVQRREGNGGVLGASEGQVFLAEGKEGQVAGDKEWVWRG